MKQKERFQMLLLTLLLAVFSLNATAASRRTVERGMTKQQVTDILGKPKAASFDQAGTRWEYIKGRLIDNYDIHIRVEFDARDRVVNYQETIIPRGDNRNADILVPDDGFRRPAPGFYADCLSEEEFAIVSNSITKANFDDNKLALVEVACLRSLFTCRQCARLLQLFSFSDAKLKALRFMARQIVDPQNAYDIYQAFTFDSDRDKAARLMHDLQN